MKHSIYLIALAVFFIFGCQSESPNSSTMRVNDPNFPTDVGGGDAVFDIPTPSMTGAEQGDAIGDNYPVQVCWTYAVPADAYYTSTTYYPQGNQEARHQGLVPTTTLNPGALHSPYEFWGGSQRTIVTINNGGQDAYSGHYELYRSTDGGTTWSGNILPDADKLNLCYTDDNDGAGFPVGTELVYKVKEKSLEGSTPNDVTHHSLASEGIEITIEEPCVEEEIDPIFEINPILGSGGGNGTWNTAATMWTANSSATNQNMNMFYRMNQINRTQNSCTGEITETDVVVYTGNVYLKRSNGSLPSITPWWRPSLPYSDDNAYHHNGNETGGNNSGLGKFGTGCHTISWTVDTTAGAMGTFILNMNSTCP